MTLLLLLTGALLAVSGVVKIRAGTRTGIGVSVWALLELVFALSSGILAAAGSAAASMASWFVPMAVLLVLGSSVRFGLRLRAHRRRREETEGGRLATYVKYLSND